MTLRHYIILKKKVVACFLQKLNTQKNLILKTMGLYYIDETPNETIVSYVFFTKQRWHLIEMDCSFNINPRKRVKNLATLAM